MTWHSPQPLLIDRFSARSRATLLAPVLPRSSATALLLVAFGFFAFLPYPALSIGGSSAIQMGNVLTLLTCFPLLMVFTGQQRHQAIWTLPVLLAPLLLSILGASLGGDDLMLSFKTIAVWLISALAMTATQLHAPRYALELLTGIALATLLHVALGVYQLYCFSSNVFPFPDLYVNPSFLSVQDNANIIARYIQRPFGLFPEPSAMTASLAPWVLLWIAESFGLLRFRREPPPWQRWIFSLAAAGGLALIILSQSGHAAVTLASLALFSAVGFKRCRATLRTYITLLIAICVIAPCIFYFGAQSLGERIGGKSPLGNSSWEERSDSLAIGLKLVLQGNFTTIVFGLGAGLSAPAIWSSSRIDAVFSVLLTYIYETGLVGVAAVGVVASHLGRIAITTTWKVAFLCILFTWLVGVTLTTSYAQLLPLWIALGWLTVWTQTCAPVHAEAPVDLQEQR
jgi:hypothetical protein